MGCKGCLDEGAPFVLPIFQARMIGKGMGKMGGEIVMQAKAMGEALEKLADGILENACDRQKLVLVGIHTGGVHLAHRLQRVILDKCDLSVPVGTLDITL